MDCVCGEMSIKSWPLPKEMVYGGESRESIAELVSDLKSEITGYLDAVDTSSFYDQQGLPMEAADAYGEYSRTALYQCCSRKVSISAL